MEKIHALERPEVKSRMCGMGYQAKTPEESAWLPVEKGESMEKWTPNWGGAVFQLPCTQWTALPGSGAEPLKIMAKHSPDGGLADKTQIRTPI